MYIPWQIEQDIARSRIKDTTRAAKYAYRTAQSRRRPMRAIASILRWMTERVEDALPRRATDRHTTALAPTADIDRPDLRLTVIATNGREDSPLGAGAALAEGHAVTLVHVRHHQVPRIDYRR